MRQLISSGTRVFGVFAFCSVLMAQGSGKNNIDLPSGQQTYSGAYVFGGWAMNSTARIATVNISIDGAPYGNAAYGGNRQDACAAIGNYPGCPYVGYSFYFDTSHIVNGSHTLTTTAITTDSQETSQTVRFSTSNNASSYVDIDTPSTNYAGQTFSDQVTFGGWTVDASATISRIDITIDDTSYGIAGYGGYRQDACNAIGNYPGRPYVGWNFYLDTTQLSDGKHALTITSITSDGRSTSNSASFITLNGVLAQHQSGYNPYGLDQWGGGTLGDLAQQAHAQCVRILVPWAVLEPDAPTMVGAIYRHRWPDERPAHL